MEMGDDNWAMGSRAILIAILVLTALPLSPGSSASPSDERVDVDIELETSYIEMAVSTQEFTERDVQGWVEMLKKPPGETIEVKLSVSHQGQYVLGTYVAPPSLFFFYEGVQYFNLSIRFQEDSPPGFEYLVGVDAAAESLVGSDLDTFHLTVVTVPQLHGEAEMLEHPPDARPGDITTGVVQVTNTGTKYALYRMSISQDPSAVVGSVVFNLEVEMTPNWVEKVPFDIMVSNSALPGEYYIVMTLEVIHDDGSMAIVDTFNVHITVMEEKGETTLPYMAITVVAVLVIVFVIAILLRRKASP